MKSQSSTSPEHGRRKHDHSEARDQADKFVIDAEKSKADVVAPKGKQNVQYGEHDFVNSLLDKFSNNLELKRFFDNDDEFFHIACHIEPSLRTKIQNGEYVELEKLLPRSGNKLASANDDKRLELVFSKEGTFVAPSQDREVKINSARKWEQAFRIYAAIYTKENPSRSHEIWKYIHVINMAAATHSWDNVAYYDFTFRQLMASKPWRSWAKIYSQGWNLALNESVSRNSNPMQPYTIKTPAKHDWRDNCCWKFNKNRCSHTATNCNFDH